MESAHFTRHRKRCATNANRDFAKLAAKNAER